MIVSPPNATSKIPLSQHPIRLHSRTRLYIVLKKRLPSIPRVCVHSAPFFGVFNTHQTNHPCHSPRLLSSFYIPNGRAFGWLLHGLSSEEHRSSIFKLCARFTRKFRLTLDDTVPSLVTPLNTDLQGPFITETRAVPIVPFLAISTIPPTSSKAVRTFIITISSTNNWTTKITRFDISQFLVIGFRSQLIRFDYASKGCCKEGTLH